MLSYIHGLKILDFLMSLKVFKGLLADKNFCFSKTLLSLTFIGWIILLPCLVIGRCGSRCMLMILMSCRFKFSPSWRKFWNISMEVSFFSQTSFLSRPCIDKFSFLLWASFAISWHLAACWDCSRCDIFFFRSSMSCTVALVLSSTSSLLHFFQAY